MSFVKVTSLVAACWALAGLEPSNPTITGSTVAPNLSFHRMISPSIAVAHVWSGAPVEDTKKCCDHYTFGAF